MTHWDAIAALNANFIASISHSSWLPYFSTIFPLSLHAQLSHKLPTTSTSAIPPPISMICLNLEGRFVYSLRNVMKWAHFSSAQEMWARSDGRESRSRISWTRPNVCDWFSRDDPSLISSPARTFRPAHTFLVSRSKINRELDCHMVSSTVYGQSPPTNSHAAERLRIYD